jgi:hypothetical protein
MDKMTEIVGNPGDCLGIRVQDRGSGLASNSRSRGMNVGQVSQVRNRFHDSIL